jgi:hypothetical protein
MDWVIKQPEMLVFAEPLIVQIGLLWGIKDIKQIIYEIKQKLNQSQPTEGQ